MVRLSCFPAHMHYHKPKKVVQHCLQETYSQEMHTDSSEISRNMTLNVIPLTTPSNLKDDGILLSTNTEQISTTSPAECCWKSEELNAMSYSPDGHEIVQSMSLKKSHSLGSGLDREGIFSSDVKTDDEIDLGLPLGDFKDMRLGRIDNSFENSRTAEICGCHDLGIDLVSQKRENMFERNTDSAFNESIFSIEDIKQLDSDFYEYHGRDLPSDDAVELGHMHTSPTFSKSCTLPKLGVHEFSLACGTLGHRSRSVGNLCDEEMKTGLSHSHRECNSREPFHQYREASSCHDMSQASDVIDKILHFETDFGEQCGAFGASKEYKEMADNEKDFMTIKGHHECANEFTDEKTPHNFMTYVNDWREPETDSTGYDNVQEKSLAEPWHELDSEDFNMKRITEWIHQIDIDNSIVQEVGESSNGIPNMEKDSHMISGSKSSKPNVKGGDGVKVAYNYISSLAPASTSAQMKNLGLVVIPFLSAFSSLRVLNLSGNAIGLAACSSLKELYLAGNKISEIEGLHRLLKLNILDLQFNKISTVKSLGQLAANYGSLQAINLEGNPVQRNAGDDQLKKYLHSLLPRLVYFNKHIIRNSLSKEASDRPRSANSRQYDRGTRSDHKRTQRGHTPTSSHKVTSSSNHLKASQVKGSLPRLPRHRVQHPDLPIPEPKAYHLPKTSRKLLSSLQAINPMRRSQSAGNL